MGCKAATRPAQANSGPYRAPTCHFVLVQLCHMHMLIFAIPKNSMIGTELFLIKINDALDVVLNSTAVGFM
eukprot:6098360-Prymnesium_polylepis.1